MHALSSFRSSCRTINTLLVNCLTYGKVFTCGKSVRKEAFCVAAQYEFARDDVALPDCHILYSCSTWPRIKSTRNVHSER